MKSELILKELSNILHNNKDKYFAHELIQKKLKDLCLDMNFIHNSLKECIMRKNFLYDAKNLFFYLLVEGDVIIAINLFPPIFDKEKNITHDNIHHHGWRLLSTGVISGQGYETINFTKNSHKNNINGEVRLAIKDQYVHKKGEIKFIDSYQAHVVFQPESTSATLAVWSAERDLKNQKIKKLLKNFPNTQKIISQLAHKINLNKFFGLNQTEGVYFHPENGKIVITKNYSKPSDGERYEILHCMFKFFQQIKLNENNFFLKVKEICPPEARQLCDKLINDEFISDLGIKGDIRRRFTKNQILEAINNKSYDR